MPQSTDVRIKNVQASTEDFNYRTPIKFGGRVVHDVTLLNIEIEVETHAGQTAVGKCSVPMGNVWAWPSNVVSGEDTLSAMTTLGLRLAEHAHDYSGAGHPLEITHDLASSRAQLVQAAANGLAEPMPKLAELVSASPIEGALHDAFGKVHNASCYNALGPEFANHDLSHYLGADFAGEYLHDYTRREPAAALPLYHLVGALDPLTASDVATPVGDGLPETLGEWIADDGLTHLKIKLNGDDLMWDVNRVVAVNRACEEAAPDRSWNYSLDFNEKCQNVAYVIDFLNKLAELSDSANDRVQYIEQPTHRDLRANPENRMHEAAKIKPVVIDESLVDFESLLLAREQGYSGVALKACKGHSEALLMGAAAQKYGMFLCVQDLTCVGLSFLHSASLAAHIPTVAAIEGNGRQYCPAGNAGWSDRFPGMFDITTGRVFTKELAGNGFGA